MSADSTTSQTDSPAATGGNAAPVPGSKVLLGMLLTWLVPGAGHALLGRGGKAVLYFVLVTFAFVFGMWLGDFRNVSLENFQLHFLAQVFYGGAALPALFLTQDLGLTREIPLLDAGVLFTAVAGLLNLCVIVDVFETAYPRPAGEGE